MLRTFKKGFTLVELLIVVVIIGILAAIAVPKISEAKEKAYVAAMKSDLRNLVTAMEIEFDNNSQYPAGLAAPAASDTLALGLGALGDGDVFVATASSSITGFRSSAKIKMFYIEEDGTATAGDGTTRGTDSVWAVRAVHAQLGNQTAASYDYFCDIVVGRTALSTNQPVCTTP